METRLALSIENLLIGLGPRALLNIMIHLKNTTLTQKETGDHPIETIEAAEDHLGPRVIMKTKRTKAAILTRKIKKIKMKILAQWKASKLKGLIETKLTITPRGFKNQLKNEFNSDTASQTPTEIESIVLVEMTTTGIRTTRKLKAKD